MPDKDSLISHEHIKKFSRFDIYTNTAVKALAASDQEGYFNAVSKIVSDVLVDDEAVGSFLMYLISTYATVLINLHKITGRDINDYLDDGSLFDITVGEDPEQFFL